jgi:hypothetical protein
MSIHVSGRVADHGTMLHWQVFLPDNRVVPEVQKTSPSFAASFIGMTLKPSIAASIAFIQVYLCNDDSGSIPCPHGKRAASHNLLSQRSPQGGICRLIVPSMVDWPVVGCQEVLCVRVITAITETSLSSPLPEAL